MPFIAAIPAALAIGGATAAAGVAGALKGRGGSSNLEQQALDTSQQELELKRKAIADTEPFLSQFYQGGDLSRTPFYKKLLTLGTGSTTQAYNQAKVNMAQKANMAGYGYQQPATQGAEAGLDAREASDLARVPSEAYMGAVDQGMKAASVRTGQAAQYQPATYFQTAADLKAKNDQNRSNLWQTLAGLGTRIAMSRSSDSSWG